MPDSPDYSKYLPNSNRFSLDDMGELAVRLGSIDAFDRRGEVVWYDDFRHGLAEETIGVSGLGAGYNLNANNSFRSPFNLQLIAGSTSPFLTYTQKQIDAYIIDRLGFEFSFTALTDFDYFRFYIIQDTGLGQSKFAIRYSMTNSAVEFTNNLVDYTKIADYTPTAGANAKNNVAKVVCDFVNDRMVRIIIGNREYNISTLYPSTSTVTIFPSLTIATALYGLNGINSKINLHYLLVTANEP